MARRECDGLLKCADPLRGVSADREQKRQWSQDVLFMTSYNRHKLAAMSLPTTATPQRKITGSFVRLEKKNALFLFYKDLLIVRPVTKTTFLLLK